MSEIPAPQPAALELRVVAAARQADSEVEVIHIDPDLADTEVFCRSYDYSLEESCNCLFVSSRTGPPAFAACLVQASRRLDLNRHSRVIVGARKASFASPEDTIEVTGMIPGGVTPVGLPPGLRLFIDRPIMDLPRIIIGGGGRGVKLRLSPQALLAHPDTVVADISSSPDNTKGRS